MRRGIKLKALAKLKALWPGQPIIQIRAFTEQGRVIVLETEISQEILERVVSLVKRAASLP